MGEFHLASKYGKNASCSSGDINGVPQGYVCFVRPCDCARADTLRSYARPLRDGGGNREEGLHLNERGNVDERRLRQWFPNHPDRLSRPHGRPLIKFKYFRAVQAARSDGRRMSDSETKSAVT